MHPCLYASLFVWYKNFIMIMAVVDSLRAVKVSSSFKTSSLNVVNTPSTYEMLKVLIRYLSAFALDGTYFLAGSGLSAEKTVNVWRDGTCLLDRLKITLVYKVLQLMYKTVIQLIPLHTTDRGFITNRMHEQ